MDVLLAPDGCGYLSNGPDVQCVRKEPCETPKTYASSTTLPGPTSYDYVKRLDDSIQHAYTRLLSTQARYKRDFDKRIRKIRQLIKPEGYVYKDPIYGRTIEDR